MSETTHALTTSHRWPPGGTKPGAKPVPVPIPTLDPTRRPPALPTGRRALLAGIPVALAFGAVVPALAAGANTDAQLLALCAEYVALDKAFAANSQAGADMLSTDPAWKALNAEGCAMVPRLHELETLIAETTPHTRTGLLAKAEAARRSLVSDGDDEEGGELMNFETYLACTLIENLLAMTGGKA